MHAVDDGAVRSAMRSLVEGRIEEFQAVDAEMGLSVAVVAKNADRYCVRRKPVGQVAASESEDEEETMRDEWRSQRWIESMLAQGHWVPC